jgi:hypothetical protein
MDPRTVFETQTQARVNKRLDILSAWQLLVLGAMQEDDQERRQAAIAQMSEAFHDVLSLVPSQCLGFVELGK